jgi:hypothetical protein
LNGPFSKMVLDLIYRTEENILTEAFSLAPSSKVIACLLLIWTSFFCGRRKYNENEKKRVNAVK